VGPVESCAYAGVFTTVNKINCALFVDLFANAGAPAAKDAQVVVPVHKGINLLNFEVFVNDWNFQVINFVFIGKHSKLACVPVAAKNAPGHLPGFEGAGTVFFARLAMKTHKARAGMAA